MSAQAGTLRVLMVGDIILDEPAPDGFFEPSRALLQAADVVIGHVEVPHTDRGVEQSTDVPAPPAKPEHLSALARAGFHIATLAGNHMHDAGPAGIEDTAATLRGLGLATTGAGANLHSARTPAVVQRGGSAGDAASGATASARSSAEAAVRVGVLSYNCVGPREGWATSGKPGCAYVKVLTHYELDHASPGGTPNIYTFCAPESLAAMAADIEALRARCELLVVALHKGVGHVPARIEWYERQVAQAAIVAGADAVIGHHAHILRGIEFHLGKPIFHGLGNFVTVTRALSLEANASPERLAWAKRREQLFGFKPDPRMPTYPFHPESRNTIVAALNRLNDGTWQAGYVPCWIDEQARPVPLAREDAADTVAYVRRIGVAAGFHTHHEWHDDWVRVRPATPGAGA